MSENPMFSYTKRDYEGSRKEGISRIPILSNGQWTDLNATDPGVIILDYVHAIVDMINYYQDHQAMETFISTARERENIFRLAKQFSYNIMSAKGATVDVTFSSHFRYDFPIKIPKHTALSTHSGIQYITTEDAYLDKGEIEVSVPCSQGVVYEKSYTGTGISRFSTTEDADNQAVYLTAPNIDIESIRVVDNQGRLWSPVDYIVFSRPLDRVYQVELNPDDSVTIRFGDGVRGVVPQSTDTLTIQYIVTNAESGIVREREIVELLNPIYHEGYYIEFLVTNKKASSNGYSIQSSVSIRESAPGAIKAQGRAVTLSDFENLAKLVPGVSEAKAYDINTMPDLCLYHEVKVLIVPTDLSNDNTELEERVYKYLYDKMIPPTNLQVLTPSAVPIDIHIVVRKMDNAVASRLSYNIYQAIGEYFRSRSGAIGEDFYPSDLSATIQNIEGVRYIISTDPTSPISIGDLSVATQGQVIVDIQ